MWLLPDHNWVCGVLRKLPGCTGHAARWMECTFLTSVPNVKFHIKRKGDVMLRVRFVLQTNYTVNLLLLLSRRCSQLWIAHCPITFIFLTNDLFIWPWYSDMLGPFCCCFCETWSLYVVLAIPEFYVDQAGLEFTEICLALSLECWEESPKSPHQAQVVVCQSSRQTTL